MKWATFSVGNHSEGPIMEKRDARERFVELANKRVTKAIKDMRLVGNLANRRSYTYTDSDAKKIIRALQDELNALKARFIRSLHCECRNDRALALPAYRALHLSRQGHDSAEFFSRRAIRSGNSYSRGTSKRTGCQERVQQGCRKSHFQSGPTRFDSEETSRFIFHLGVSISSKTRE